MEIRREKKIHTATELLYITPLVFESSDKVGEHKQHFSCAGFVRAYTLFSDVLKRCSLEILECNLVGSESLFELLLSNILRVNSPVPENELKSP